MNTPDEVAKREEERLARSLNRIPNRRSTFNTKQSSPAANTSSSNSTTPTTTPTKTEPRQRPLSQQVRSPLTYNTPPPSSSTPQRTIERSSSAESKSQEESSTTTTNETVSTHNSSSTTTTPATENDRHVITGVRSNSIKAMIEREESRLAKLFDSPSPSDRRKSASFVVRSPSQGSTPTPSPGLARRPTVAASFTKSPSYTGSASDSNTPQRLTSSASHDGTSSTPVSTPSKTEPAPSSSSTSSSTPAPAPSTPATSSTTTSVPSSVPSTSPSNSNPNSPASNRKPASTNTTPQKDKPAVLKELDDLLSSVNQTAAASHNRRASVNFSSPASTPTKAAPKPEETAPIASSSSNDFDDIMEVLTELGQTPVPKSAPVKTESSSTSSSSSSTTVHSNSSSASAASSNGAPAAEQKKMPVDVSELESDLDALLKKHQDAYKKAEQLLHQVHVEQQPHPTPAPAQAPAPAPSPAPQVNDRSKAISSLDDILNTLNATPVPAPVAVAKPAETKPAEPAKSSTSTQSISTSTSSNSTTSSAPPATVAAPVEPTPALAQPAPASKQPIERRRSVLLEKPPAPMTQEEVNKLLTDVVSTGKQIVAILNNANHPSAFDAQRFGLLATSVIKNMTYSINGLPIDETTRANLIHQTRELASECHAFALTSDIGAITVDHFQRDQDKIRESLLTLFKSLRNIKDNVSNPSKSASTTVALPPRGASLSKEVGDLAHEILAILKEQTHDNDRFSSKLQQFVRTVKANLNTFPDSEITLKNNLIDQLKTLLHKGIELNTHDGALSYKIEFVEHITAFLKSGRF